MPENTYHLFFDSFLNTILMFGSGAMTAVFQQPWIPLVLLLVIVVAVMTPKRRRRRYPL